MANGTSGDANNINFRNPQPRKQPYEQMRYVAEDVATKVNAALQGLTWQNSAPLASRIRELDVKWRKIEPELITWAKETEAKAPRIQGGKATCHLAHAGRVQRLAKASPETKFPAQILRIGDVIGSSPCETFAETGDAPKRSPFAKSFMVVELAHGYYGYMPTPATNPPTRRLRNLARHKQYRVAGLGKAHERAAGDGSGSEAGERDHDHDESFAVFPIDLGGAAVACFFISGTGPRRALV